MLLLDASLTSFPHSSHHSVSHLTVHLTKPPKLTKYWQIHLSPFSTSNPTISAHPAFTMFFRTREEAINEHYEDSPHPKISTPRMLPADRPLPKLPARLLTPKIIRSRMQPVPRTENPRRMSTLWPTLPQLHLLITIPTPPTPLPHTLEFQWQT
jgi:hypothetical protein